MATSLQGFGAHDELAARLAELLDLVLELHARSAAEGAGTRRTEPALLHYARGDATSAR